MLDIHIVEFAVTATRRLVRDIAFEVFSGHITVATMQQSVATGIFKYLKLRLFVIGREECGVFVTNTERQLQIIFNAVPVVTEPNFRSETCQLKMNK